MDFFSCFDNVSFCLLPLATTLMVISPDLVWSGLDSSDLLCVIPLLLLYVSPLDPDLHPFPSLFYPFQNFRLPRIRRRSSFLSFSRHLQSWVLQSVTLSFRPPSPKSQVVESYNCPFQPMTFERDGCTVLGTICFHHCFLSQQLGVVFSLFPTPASQ